MMGKDMMMLGLNFQLLAAAHVARRMNWSFKIDQDINLRG